MKIAPGFVIFALFFSVAALCQDTTRKSGNTYNNNGTSYRYYRNKANDHQPSPVIAVTDSTKTQSSPISPVR